MTRETKVGLVVAGSFLCLLTTVVVLKMKEGDRSADRLAGSNPSQQAILPDVPPDPTPSGQASSGAPAGPVASMAGPGTASAPNTRPAGIRLVNADEPVNLVPVPAAGGSNPLQPSGSPGSGGTGSPAWPLGGGLAGNTGTQAQGNGATQPVPPPATPANTGLGSNSDAGISSDSTVPGSRRNRRTTAANDNLGTESGVPASVTTPLSGGLASPPVTGREERPATPPVNPDAPPTWPASSPAGFGSALPQAPTGTATPAFGQGDPLPVSGSPAAGSTLTGGGMIPSTATPTAMAGNTGFPSAPAPVPAPPWPAPGTNPAVSETSPSSPAPAPSTFTGSGAPVTGFNPATNHPAGGAMPAFSGSTPLPTPVTPTTGVPPATGFAPGNQDPGVQLRTPVPVPAAPAAGGQSGSLLRPGVAPDPRQATPPAGDDAPEPINRTAGVPGTVPAPAPMGFAGVPNPTPERPMPPLGAPAAVVSPPIVAPVPPGSPRVMVSNSPQVESFDEEVYFCKPNDSFLEISKLKYHSDRYDRALLQYNRNHPQAPAGIQQSPPDLKQGQPVFIPPVRVLEKRYPNVIQGLAPLPPINPPVGTPGGVETPRAAPVNPGQAGTAATWSNPGGGRPYRVRASGEKFLEIARRTLGSADRWWDIYMLNRSQLSPNFNANDPLPAGTVLRLPADARIEPADAP